MDPPTQQATSRHMTLWVLRAIWLVLVVGQLAFGLVAFMAARGGQMDAQTQLRTQMLAIAIGALIGAVGMGYYIRNQFYKRHWQEHAVMPQGFFLGNLILFFLLDGVSLLTLVFVMMSAQLFPMILPAVISLAVQVANFPSGAPMESVLPEFAQTPR